MTDHAQPRGDSDSAPGETGETAGASACSDGESASHLPVAPASHAEPAGDTDPSAGFTLAANGVYYRASDSDDAKWIASPIQVVADSRDSDSTRWGRVFLLSDPDGVKHKVTIPRRLFAGDGRAVIGELLDHGASVAGGNGAQRLLLTYLQCAETGMRAQSVERTGWHELTDGRVAFVQPESVIGAPADQVLFVADSKQARYGTRGTLDEWRTHVAARCVGNSRLVFPVAAAFAATLLHVTGDESGGFHFVGGSSTGKTTALRMAASVYGGPSFMHRWRATANAIDALAAQHCDSLLILDEMGQVNPKEAGEIAYSLANGQGKARAFKTGTGRPVLTWRVLFLSAGEVGLAIHMQEGGKRARAGQETRLAEIGADAGKGMGMFEHLHGAADGNAFATILGEATRMFYGHAGPEFVRLLIGDRPAWSALREEVGALATRLAGTSADGQVQRVARRFALVAVAGELATRYGITGWPPGEAIRAARECLGSWIAQRGGTGNREPAEVLAQVRGFFERHGDSRFAPRREDDGSEGARYPVRDRAGFREPTTEGPKFYVLREVMRKEVLAGLNERDAVKVLLDRGVLQPDNDGKATRSERLPGMRTRVYVVTPKLWESTDDV